MEDVIHATSSHPRKPIAPIPLTQFSSSAATAVATKTATAPAEPTTAKRPRWHPNGEYQPPQNRPRSQAAPQAPRSSSLAPEPQHRPHSQAATSKAAAPTIAATTAPAKAKATTTAKAAANVNAKAVTASANTADLFPARRYRKAIPDFVPIRPDEFASHHHPLTIRTPRDVVRFFPFATSAAATLAGLSGLLAGCIANRLLGGDIPPAYFMAGYLALFLLNFLTHCFAAKGKLFFHNRRRFLGLLAANALLLLPHFIAYSILIGMAAK